MKVSFEKKDVALIVALDEQNCVILKKGYRYPVNEVLYELSGGMIEEGEDPLETAKRELLEETGYTCEDWKQIMCGYDYPSKSKDVPDQSDKGERFCCRNSFGF